MTSTTIPYRLAALLTVLLLLVGFATMPSAAADDAPQTRSGNLPDGTPYLFIVPTDWNGTVLVDLDFAPGGGTHQQITAELLDRGYARAGTSRTVTGWNIRQAIDNQAATLERFAEEFGEPDVAVAWGTSMGGFVAAGFAQEYPEMLDGALPFCGGLGGSVGQWNGKLDAVFAAKALLAPDSDLPVTDIPADVSGATNAWRSTIAQAQQTPEGRARIALVGTIGQIPAWGAGTAQPDPRDTAAVQEGLFLTFSGGPLPFVGQAMSSRRQIETLAGGNPSWNTGIDYAELFNAGDPFHKQAVRELYRDAGLDLQEELAAINATPRIEADVDAVTYLSNGIVFDGDLQVPVLTVNNIGDQISTVTQQQAYEAGVRRAGRNTMLRQSYVATSGHCSFSTAERLAAVEALMERIETGQWRNTTRPRELNASANSMGLGPARFVDHKLDRFNRPFYRSDADALID